MRQLTALSTDLYELTMMAGYWRAGAFGTATFDLFVRGLPDHRSFLVAAGIEQALDYLEHLRFTPDEIAYLRGLPNFRAVPAEFFDRYLPELRFTGEVWAVEEGTPVFGGEPLLRVSAPVAEAQVVETALLAILMFQTSIASKAARVVQAAAGRPVIEFGGRRAHGLEAAMYAARAAYLAGCAGTSNVEAGFRFGIPVSGTMAHSWVMAFPGETDAFREFQALYPEHAVLLLDTYDTVEAARRVVAAGLHPVAVRLDSGDLDALSRGVRSVLDEGGLSSTRIFASGDLDEYRISGLVAAGAPIDGFGVGTALSTSSDAPALGGVYKLAEIERSGSVMPAMKLSADKRTYPGRKQVWRIVEEGMAVTDVIGLADEPNPANGVPLLRPVMRHGRREGLPRSLEVLRAQAADALASVPSSIRRLEDAASYQVTVSDRLARITDDLADRLSRQEGLSA